MKKKNLFLILLVLTVNITVVQAQTIYYVKAGGAGTKDASSWLNASDNLQTVLTSKVVNNDIVYVAKGTYTAPAGASFTCNKTIKVYGSFNGDESELYSIPDTTNNVTNLVGNGGVYRVLAVTNNSEWVGFKISGGNSGTATGGGVTLDAGCKLSYASITGNTGKGGGGVYNKGTLQYCQIYGNTSTTIGGGVDNELAAASISYCSIHSNTGTSNGGGIYNNGGTIDNCTISANIASTTAAGSGGGIYNVNATSIVTNSFINKNTASNGNFGGKGGGIYNVGTVSDCTISENKALTAGYNQNGVGGGVYNTGKVYNCIIDGNIASANSTKGSSTGGGISNISPGIVANCLITNNATIDKGGGIDNPTGCQIINCTVTKNNSSGNGGGINNYGTVKNSIVWGNTKIAATNDIYASGTITYSLYSEATAINGNINSASILFIDASTGNYRLSTGSPCINAGNGDLSSLTITTDIAGAPRVFNSTIDMGAYESSYISAPVNASTLTLNTKSELSVLSGATLIINSSTELNSITVEAGGKLTNNSNQTLTAATLTLKSDATGNATYVDNGTSAITSGTVQQYLSSSRNWYLTPSINSATVPAGQTYYSYDESGSNTGYTSPATAFWKALPATTALTAGIGYIAQPSVASTLSYTGTLKTGNVTVTLTRTGSTSVAGYNLVANPYPSYLNAMSAINANANVQKTIWYRTCAAGGTYHFETVNTTSGVGTNAAETGTVTGYVPPMQAFWVRTNTNDQTITFTNAMRAHAGDITVGAGTVPTTNLKAPKQSTQQLLRLRITNGESNDESVIYFNSNATNGLDDYDSQKRFNNTTAIPEIYTQVGTAKLAINGMNAVPYDTEIPLGFTTGQSNAFSIKTSEFSNFDPSTKVYLKDNLLNTEQDLTDRRTYTFASDVASTTSRFSLVFRSVELSNGIQAASENQSILIYKNVNNQIAVNCYSSISDNAFISVFNALGQKLESKQITSATTVIDRTFNSGAYVVTVYNGGTSITKKVILN